MLRLALAALVAGAGLFSASAARAGPFDWLHRPDPPPSYSPWHYWAPAATQLNDHLHGPRLSVYAPDRHPEIPPSVVILEFSHPAVPAGATLIEPPPAPATSKFHY